MISRNFFGKTYFKCTALVLVFSPMQFLMFSATVKGFVTSRTPLVSLNMAICTNKLVRSNVTHIFSAFFFTKFFLKITWATHYFFSDVWCTSFRANWKLQLFKLESLDFFTNFHVKFVNSSIFRIWSRHFAHFERNLEKLSFGLLLFWFLSFGVNVNKIWGKK